MRRHSRAESRNRGPTRHPDARRAWLAEAARLIVQPPGYPRDAALRRAAALTGIRIDQQADFDAELADAVRAYRALFQPDAPEPLRALRTTALEAMRFLARFHPRLGGAAADGSAGAHDSVEIWLFPQSAKDVVHWLIEHDMPYDNGPDYALQRDESIERAASLRVVADDVEVHLILLPGEVPRDGIRRRRGESPEQLITAGALKKLLATRAADSA
ncbi:MAG: hypothetical protein KDJ14_06355 [Xanthomonadales bacterium]|nr:hypothetical protein [Xanthomonadales bacterium]